MKVLWKSKLDGPVRVLNPDDLPNSGFRSVYCFGDEDSVRLEKEGYAGFRGVVYSDTLFIDCDTDDVAQEVEENLYRLGLSYKEFDTGGRGRHFHVEREACSGDRLPEADKHFVRTELSQQADLSFYHHVGFYRCIGAVHQRTGKRKMLVGGFTGNPVRIDPNLPERQVRNTAPTSLQSVFTDRALQIMTVPINEGERHKRFIEIGLALHRLGQPYDFSFGYLVNVSLMSEKQLSEKDLTRILDWVYYEKAY